MTDTTSQGSVVPADPSENWRPAIANRAGVMWHWDQVALWWPDLDMLAYYRLGLPSNEPVLKHALKLRDFYISMLTEEQKTVNVDTTWRETWPALHAQMLANKKIHEDADKRVRRYAIRGGAIIVAIIAGMAGCTALANAGISSDDTELSQITTQNLCEGMVKEELKSPSTAQFSDEVAIGSNPIIVTGNVDSQNGFGAMLRSSFHCTGTPDGQGVSTTLDSITPQ